MTATTTWRRTSARPATRRPGVPTRHPRVHAHAPVTGLGIGLLVPRH
jgi:hypothetical protein